MQGRMQGAFNTTMSYGRYIAHSRALNFWIHHLVHCERCILPTIPYIVLAMSYIANVVYNPPSLAFWFPISGMHRELQFYWCHINNGINVRIWIASGRCTRIALSKFVALYCTFSCF